MDRIDEVDLDDVDHAADIVGDLDLYDGKKMLISTNSGEFQILVIRYWSR